MEPTPEQRDRVLKLAAAVLPLLAEQWPARRLLLDEHGSPSALARSHAERRAWPRFPGQEELRQGGAAVVACLRTALSDEEIPRALADALAFPALLTTALEPAEQPRGLLQRLLNRPASRATHPALAPCHSILIQRMAADWTREHPSEYAAEVLCRRLQYLMEHPYEEREPDPLNVWASLDNLTAPAYGPSLSGTVWLLQGLASQPKALEILEAIAFGDQVVPPPPDPADRIAAAMHTAYQRISRKLMHEVLLLRFQQDRLDYDYFRKAVARYPDQIISRPFSDVPRPPNSPDYHYLALRQEYSRRLAWELAENFTPEAATQFVEFSELHGARFLLKACEHIERLKIRSVPRGKESGTAAALGRMACIAALEPEDNPAVVVAKLRTFRPETLDAVAYLAGVAKPLVLRALDRENVILMLLNDDKITDQAIAGQIRRHATGQD